MNSVSVISQWSAIAPELIITLVGIIVLLADLIMDKRYLVYFSLAGAIMALIASFGLWGMETTAFNGMLIVDNYSVFFNTIFLFAAILTLLLSDDYLRREGVYHGEYYALILFATAGMMLMAASGNLIVIFLGLELLSVCFYILAGFIRSSIRSNESSLKYFLLGAFASGFLLYGIALVYGSTGTLDIRGIADVISQNPLRQIPLLVAGMGLLLVGFGFKVAVVPFHTWTPDVYEGAPTPITACMATGVKAAGFAAFLRVFLYAFKGLQDQWSWLIWIVAALTMTLGNVVAISQTNLKRMLAYSSIAHAGYILVAFVAANELGSSAILFYLLAYTFMNVGAFGILIAMGQREHENLNYSDYSGLGLRRPGYAALMSLFMLSLSGIPGTAGFVGKFYIFSAAVKAGFIGLTVIGVINSAISIYFYFKVIVYMYMRDPTEEFTPAQVSPAVLIALIISALGIIQMGILPAKFLEIAQKSIVSLFV